ncbi:MAG: sensor histidine kinase [Candidatus Eiseniibacteriota bacterium]
MEKLRYELIALGFQAVLTLLLAVAWFGLWRRQRHPYFASWAAAWLLYVVRLGAISAYVQDRRDVWLFAHQAATFMIALLQLAAALQFSSGMKWRRGYALVPVAAVVWAAIAAFVIRDLRISGTVAALALSGVTLWTSLVFWRHRQRVPSGGATVLAWTFLLWGVHHLDYPLLRSFGQGVVYGVYVDVLLIVAVSLGTLFLVLGDERRALASRSLQLEQLTRLLLKTQEEERRRIARELHDEAGQVLTALKIEFDLEGRRKSSDMVSGVLAHIRNISHLLRPAELDDLGLLPAVRGLVEDFSARTRIEAVLVIGDSVAALSEEAEVAVYRVVQEALTNVARHAQARHVTVKLETDARTLKLSVNDDGRGAAGTPAPNLGLLGMRERVTALGGTITVRSRPQRGFSLAVEFPIGAHT